MGDLTKNFSRFEFACNCGCGMTAVDFELINCLQTLRDVAKCPIIITSGNRCEKQNKAIGGAEDSFHLYSLAVDILSVRKTPKQLYALLDNMYPQKYGLILYKKHIHFDVRGEFYRGKSLTD